MNFIILGQHNFVLGVEKGSLFILRLKPRSKSTKLSKNYPGGANTPQLLHFDVINIKSSMGVERI